MVRWRHVLLAAGLFLLGTTLGPPLIGAASTAFWSDAADGNTAGFVAMRVYDRISAQPVGLALIAHDEQLEDISLGINCHKHYGKRLESVDPGTHELLTLIRRSTAQQLYQFLEVGPSITALLTLPRPVLGGLDGCIAGSPISRFCSAYVLWVTDKAKVAKAPSGDRFLARLRRDNEAIWCAAAAPGQA